MSSVRQELAIANLDRAFNSSLRVEDILEGLAYHINQLDDPSGLSEYMTPNVTILVLKLALENPTLKARNMELLAQVEELSEALSCQRTSERAAHEQTKQALAAERLHNESLKAQLRCKRGMTR